MENQTYAQGALRDNHQRFKSQCFSFGLSAVWNIVGIAYLANKFLAEKRDPNIALFLGLSVCSFALIKETLSTCSQLSQLNKDHETITNPDFETSAIAVLNDQPDHREPLDFRRLCADVREHERGL